MVCIKLKYSNSTGQIKIFGEGLAHQKGKGQGGFSEDLHVLRVNFELAPTDSFAWLRSGVAPVVLDTRVDKDSEVRTVAPDVRVHYVVLDNAAS